MSRNRFGSRAPLRPLAQASGASEADLGAVEARLVAAHREVDEAAKIMNSRRGFLSADVDRILRLQRDLWNLLFNVRAQPPALLTGDAADYVANGGRNV